MRLSALLSINGIAVLAQEGAILPTTAPTVTSDPWWCATEDIEQYFDVPKPTGDLSTALLSYGSELIKTCTETGTAKLACPSPAASQWCAFSTAAPDSLLPEWTTYGSVASSWWSARSSTAVELARQCPVRWFHAMIGTPGGAAWLNNTRSFSACYAEANPSGPSTENLPSSTAAPASSVPTATSHTAGTSTTGALDVQTPTDVPSSARGLQNSGVGWIAVAGVGLVLFVSRLT